MSTFRQEFLNSRSAIVLIKINILANSERKYCKSRNYINLDLLDMRRHYITINLDLFGIENDFLLDNLTAYFTGYESTFYIMHAGPINIAVLIIKKLYMKLVPAI